VFTLITLAYADQLAAPDVDCEIGLVTAVPGRDTTDLPLDLVPVLFTRGGCGQTEIRARVFGPDGETIERVTGLRPDRANAFVLDGVAWEPGSYSIEVDEVYTGYVLDSFGFEVGEHTSEPPALPDVQAIYPRSDGNEVRVEVVLAEPVENGVIAVTDANGSTALGPTDLQVQPTFQRAGVGGEQCYQIRVRGPGGAFSDPVERCGDVVQDYVAPRGHQFFGCGGGCDSTRMLPTGLLFLAPLIGLRRRR